MASSTYHTIAIQGAAVRLERETHEAITPGELLAIDADEELIPHGSADGVLPGVLVALESPTAAAGTTEAIDVDYAAGDSAYYAQGQPGDVYYMWLKAGETVVKGQTLVSSDGAGAVKAIVVGAGTLTKSIVGVAEQDLTAGVGRERCLIRIT